MCFSDRILSESVMATEVAKLFCGANAPQNLLFAATTGIA
jgi:hypothetical protein